MISRRTRIIKRTFGIILVIAFVSILVAGLAQGSYFGALIFTTVFSGFIYLVIWLLGGFE
jgi:hypothetical protein